MDIRAEIEALTCFDEKAWKIIEKLAHALDGIDLDITIHSDGTGFLYPYYSKNDKKRKFMFLDGCEGFGQFKHTLLWLAENAGLLNDKKAEVRKEIAELKEKVAELEKKLEE